MEGGREGEREMEGGREGVIPPVAWDYSSATPDDVRSFFKAFTTFLNRPRHFQISTVHV